MKKSSSNRIILAAAVCLALGTSARADVFWNGSASSDWSQAANWTGGLPSTPGAGNAIINPGSPFAVPTVSSAGNFTVGQLYIAAGAGLDVLSGGSLSTVDLVTGLWGNSAAVSVSGGSLNISGILNMGAGALDGDVNISGGRVTAPNLSINTLGGAGMDISGSGSFVTGIGQLGNVNYWVTHNNITAYGGAPGCSIDIDTVTLPGSIILTAVPEPATAALFGVALALAGLARRRG